MYITLGQKKILIVISISATLFIVFLVFVYLPAKNSVEVLMTEFKETEGEINAVESMTGKGRSIDEGFSILKTKLDELDAKFPSDEKGALRSISDIAHKYGLNVVSMKPEVKIPFLSKNGKPIMIEGKYCQKSQVFVTAYSSYKGLGKFFLALKENLPQLITVEYLKMLKESGKKELRADINMTMYLLTEEK